MRKSRTDDTFKGVVDLYSGRVFNLALRMLGSHEDAEEATQDVFMRVHGSLEDFRGDSSLSTWIWRITTNVCLTRRKKKNIDAVSIDNSEIDPPDGRIENSSRQEKSVYAHESREIVDRCIPMLPPNESAVITLFYFEELSYEEISGLLNMPVGTVSTALHRGRQRLGEMLRERKDEL
ncbi:MAG: RNA polymerase sigma factor [Bacteroidetes bacterium]|nr:RNA polymerase sigma factor [Bacteroidota bacterium]